MVHTVSPGVASDWDGDLEPLVWGRNGVCLVLRKHTARIDLAHLC
ncbi:uncharacterized protein CTRU02_200297 [Colletotrichum truncatum]|uniref:Uncharacterized protein n=1 Tax=Colletotrichum truncatum TaxID=5467 RepID=A0ACC3ZE68_COLTU